MSLSTTNTLRKLTMTMAASVMVLSAPVYSSVLLFSPVAASASTIESHGGSNGSSSENEQNNRSTEDYSSVCNAQKVYGEARGSESSSNDTSCSSENTHSRSSESASGNDSNNSESNGHSSDSSNSNEGNSQSNDSHNSDSNGGNHDSNNGDNHSNDGQTSDSQSSDSHSGDGINGHEGENGSGDGRHDGEGDSSGDGHHDGDGNGEESGSGEHAVIPAQPKATFETSCGIVTVTLTDTIVIPESASGLSYEAFISAPGSVEGGKTVTVQPNTTVHEVFTYLEDAISFPVTVTIGESTIGSFNEFQTNCQPASGGNGGGDGEVLGDTIVPPVASTPQVLGTSTTATTLPVTGSNSPALPVLVALFGASVAYWITRRSTIKAR